ncbi:hypothetical protein COU79_05380 [Candidatus Peregrinibacteria bacterium CG10_big_fil_rev_8_21_14_0_10_54_7]|nr:MAG: hypothetical protein COU79_05380 [Candidatus Peregrinibacteria bacterium CG10_big_fil_rev_8_21_14_0_10_54_7]
MDRTCARWGRHRSGVGSARGAPGAGFDSAHDGGFGFALLGTRVVLASRFVIVQLIRMAHMRAEAALDELFIDRIHGTGSLVIAKTIATDRLCAMPATTPVLAFRIVLQAPGAPQ